MLRWLALVLLAAQATAQMCPGDLNGDGMVDISEVIAAVNSALSGCPVPTPPPFGCPHALNVQFDPFQCRFRGRWNDNCGGTLTVTLSSNGTIATVALDTNPLFFVVASVTGLDSADLIGWSPDEFATIPFPPLDGSLTMSPTGTELDIQTGLPQFSVDHCPFVAFHGTYITP
jgi:hypothetical protein